jgi:hypothetical protein
MKYIQYDHLKSIKDPKRNSHCFSNNSNKNNDKLQNDQMTKESKRKKKEEKRGKKLKTKI